MLKEQPYCQEIKCNFKVVGTVKKTAPPPVKICGPFKFAAGPCISSQAIILTKCSLTGLLEKFQQQYNNLHIFASKAVWNIAARDLARPRLA